MNEHAPSHVQNGRGLGLEHPRTISHDEAALTWRDDGIRVAGQACFVTARTTRSGYGDRELRNSIRQSCDRPADESACLSPVNVRDLTIGAMVA